MTDTPDADAPPTDQPAASTTDPNDFTKFQVPPKFRSAIWASEGGPGTGLNKYGYAGAYQMGTAALNSAGLYQPSKDEDLTHNQWTGQITIPGFAPMGVQDFIKNQDAQDAAFNAHMHFLADQAHTLGLDKYVGQTVGGVPITEESLASMMHFGGPAGTQRFLTSGGQYNPADGNGVKLASYGGHVANYISGQPTISVPSTETAANDGTSPVLHFPPPAQAPSPTLPGLNPQLAQLQKLALISRLMPQQNAAVPQAGNAQFPWVNALLNNHQSNPLQQVTGIAQLQALQNGGLNGYANPLLTPPLS